MIYAKSETAPFSVRLSNGSEVTRADATPDKGGSGQGFRPHELLEAALASCMTMSVRMYAQQHSIPLESVTTQVLLDRSGESEVIFRYFLELQGPLSEEQRMQLSQVAEDCPVRTTLSRGVAFQSTVQNESNRALQQAREGARR